MVANWVSCWTANCANVEVNLARQVKAAFNRFICDEQTMFWSSAFTLPFVWQRIEIVLALLKK